MSEACQHRWHFVDGQSILTCVKCGTTTGARTPDQLVEDMLKDVLTIGSAWSKGGKRIDPASVFKDHGAIHSCSYHCDRPECIKAQRDELRERLAQPEQEFIKHHGDDEGWSEWVCPDPDDYLISCCDCGLVHQAQFRVAKYAPAPSEECEVVNDPDLQAQFRMRRHAVTNPQPDSWTPEDTAHRAGGLAQPEHEPVLETVYETIIRWDEGGGKRSRRELARRIVALYAASPQRQPLTEEQINTLRQQYGVTSDGRGIKEFTYVVDFARALEAAHGIGEKT